MIDNKKNFKIKEVAKLFNVKIIFLPQGKGERYASALTNMSLNNKVHRRYGQIQLKDYIQNFIKTHSKSINF